MHKKISKNDQKTRNFQEPTKNFQSMNIQNIKNYGLSMFMNKGKEVNKTSHKKGMREYETAVKEYRQWKKQNSSDRRITTSNTPVKLNLSSKRSSSILINSESKRSPREESEVLFSTDELQPEYKQSTNSYEDCNIKEGDDYKIPMKPVDKRFTNVSPIIVKQIHKAEILRKYMTPEPQSDILHQSNITIEDNYYQSNNLPHPKNTARTLKSPQKHHKTTSKSKTKPKLPRKKSLEPHYAAIPVSIATGENTFLQRSMSIHGLGHITLNHDMHNLRKIELAKSKHLKVPTVSSAIYEILRGDRNVSVSLDISLTLNCYLIDILSLGS